MAATAAVARIIATGRRPRSAACTAGPVTLLTRLAQSGMNDVTPWPEPRVFMVAVGEGVFVVGFARRVVRKSVRRATPRPVRRAMHPARTVRNTVTPRSVKQVSRAAYTVRHPVGATENKLIGAALYPPRPRPPRPRRLRKRTRYGSIVVGFVIVGLILLAVVPWWALAGLILIAIVVPISRRHNARRSLPPAPAPPPASWPYIGPSGGGSNPVPPWQPPPTPPFQHAPPQQPPPAARQRRVEPWPASRAFRTPPPDIKPRPQELMGELTSAGDWEMRARRSTGLGDGSHSDPQP